jgi:hypothetical protein
MRVRRPGPEHLLQPRQAITEGLIAAERADREVPDGRVQPAQTLGIVQAPHGRPLPGGGYERGLDQVIGQGMVALGQGAGVSEQTRGARGETLP